MAAAGAGSRRSKERAKTKLRVSLCCLCIGALAGGTRSASADEGGASKGAPVALTPGAPVVLTPSELKWESGPGFPPFLTVVLVWGTNDAAAGRFVRFSEAKTLPLHKHTASFRIVVVSGTYVYARQGDAVRQFPPGSLVFTPAGTPHVAGCSEPCVFYEEVDGKPDFVLVQPPKSP